MRMGWHQDYTSMTLVATVIAQIVARCAKCPEEGAECPGGSAYNILKGFYAVSPSEIVACLQREA